MKKMIGILGIVIVLCIMVLSSPAAAQGILFIDVTDSQDPVFVPAPYTYTITYTFDTQASGASIIDQLPFGVEFDSASDGGIYDSTTRSVLWDVSQTSAGSVSVTVIPNHIPFPPCSDLKPPTSFRIENRAVITMILPSGPESAIGDEFTTIIDPHPESAIEGQFTTNSVSVPSCIPEFPSRFFPTIVIIGFLGAMLLIQRTKEK